MKKNLFARIASFLLIATLLSTCAISGTFAKYVTSDSVTDNARVAYWGFNGTANGEYDLFLNAYNGSGDTSVNASANVVAPGTQNSDSFTFKYTNGTNTTTGDITAPEVAYNFTAAVAVSGEYTALDNNPNFYWTLQLPGAQSATKYATIAQVETAIEALSGDYAPGTLPTGFAAGDNTFTIGWEWVFAGNAAIDGLTQPATPITTAASADAQDVMDTGMGNAADLADITINVSLSATQLDTYTAPSQG